jgi:hypothetical protein
MRHRVDVQGCTQFGFGSVGLPGSPENSGQCSVSRGEIRIERERFLHLFYRRGGASEIEIESA